MSDTFVPDNMDGGRFVKMACVSRPDLKILYAAGYADELPHDVPDRSGGAAMKKPFPLNSFPAKFSAIIFPQPLANPVPALSSRNNSVRNERRA